MSTLQRLREWIEGMLELEAKPRSGKWSRGVWGRVGVVSYDGDDVEFVAEFGNVHRESLAIAAVNAFRPFLTTTLEQIAAVEGCERCSGEGTTLEPLPARNGFELCKTCVPYRTSLERLAKKVLTTELAERENEHATE